jgi:hypothetical protein
MAPCENDVFAKRQAAPQSGLFQFTGDTMRAVITGLDKSALDLLDKAGVAFDVAKSQHEAAKTQQEGAARQHAIADKQHENADRQHELAEKQNEDAMKQTENAEKLEVSAKKLDQFSHSLTAEAVEVRGAADTLAGRGVHPTSK